MKTLVSMFVLALTSLAGCMYAQETLTWTAPDWEAKPLLSREAKKVIGTFVSKDRLCTISVLRPEGAGVSVVVFDETYSLKQVITVKRPKAKKPHFSVKFFRKTEVDDGWHPAAPSEWELFALRYASRAESQLPSWAVESFGGRYLLHR